MNVWKLKTQLDKMVSNKVKLRYSKLAFETDQDGDRNVDYLFLYTAKDELTNKAARIYGDGSDVNIHQLATTLADILEETFPTKQQEVTV